MAGPKPPPQTLEPDDERKIQIFLERASSIVLEHPVLDARHWRSLMALADELGLSETQLRATVDDLRQRGVISKVELAPSKPPPLPRRDASEADSNKSKPVADSNFALTPPPPPSPPQAAEPPSPPSPSVATSPPAPVLAPNQAAGFIEFLQRAEQIIAEQRGMGPRTQTLLAAAAREMGLPDDAVSQAVESLRGRRTAEPPAAEPAAPGDLENRRRWREEGQPDPPPPPPSRKPAEIFLAFLKSSLQKFGHREATAEHQNKLVRHGVHMLGLSDVFARHLLEEAAAEQGVSLALSAADETTEAAADQTSPELQLFLERSVPILAQHRGINAKSRVLLNALAQELGLSEQQVDEAIALAQFRGTTAQDEAEAKLLERLDAFRALARGTLVSLPRKLLTANIEQDLLRLADERFGLDADSAKSCVREICSEVDIRQISEQQAREHIGQLVDVKLAGGSRLTNDVRARIQSDGDQWGLTAKQVAAIIKERVRDRDRQEQSQRNLSNAALFAASLAVLIVVGLFGWMWISQQGPMTTSEPVASDSNPAAVSPTEEEKFDASWLGDDAKLLALARRKMEADRQTFKQIESTDASVRRAAYAKLVSLLVGDVTEPSDLALLENLLAACYANEPDAAAAQKIIANLIAKLPHSGSTLEKDEQLYATMIRAAQATAVLVSESTGQRQDEAAADLGRSLGRTIDARLQQTELELRVLEALAERLFQMLLETARSQPASVAAIHKVIAADLARYLDPARLEKLNTDFLVTVLTTAADTWQDYRDLITVTIKSKNSLNVARLLDVYEKTTNKGLQSFMAGPLLKRAGVAPEALEVAAVAGQVRKALGVSAAEVPSPRGERFLEDASRVLAAVPADLDQPDQVMTQILVLTYQSTLGCALSVDARGQATFDTLAEQDPLSFLKVPEKARDRRDEETGLEPTTFRYLNDRLRMLINPRTSSVSRSGFVESFANMVDRVKDLTPEQAESLATYLIRAKRVEEHRVVIKYIAKLRQWRNVRLAVADKLGEVSLSRALLQELAAGLLGRAYELGEGDAGREALRIELLRSVLDDTAGDEAKSQRKFEVFDLAMKAIHDFYVAQAAALQVAEPVTETESPTDVLSAIIQHVAKELQGRKLKADDRKLVDTIEVEVRAIDYVSADDLQRLVLLEEVWLRLLAIGVKQQRPDLAGAVDEQLAERAALARKATHVLDQLRSGQMAILRMWVLRNRKD